MTFGTRVTCPPCQGSGDLRCKDQVTLSHSKNSGPVAIREGERFREPLLRRFEHGTDYENFEGTHPKNFPHFTVASAVGCHFRLEKKNDFGILLRV